MNMTNQTKEFSVSEISKSIKNLVEDNFYSVAIKGEISGLTLHRASGHMYMTLKDENSSIRATCWKFNVPNLDITPEEGMEVIATGKITTYDKNSTYQLNISNIKHAGIGALLKQLEQRKAKLQAEGLFNPEYKKPIPRMPKLIGVITSQTGAVIHDIMHRINDRFPTPIQLYPVKVQGEGARYDIVKAIEFFNNPPQGFSKPDVIIVARGGGSIEDLWEFNSEEISRAVFASDIPIISAVGHEPDYTLIDYVADLRASTPTGAAELVVPVRNDLLSIIKDIHNRLNNSLENKLSKKQLNLEKIVNKTPNLQTFINNKSQKLNEVNIRKNHSIKNIISNKHNKSKLLYSMLKKPIVIINQYYDRLENYDKNKKVFFKQIFMNKKNILQNNSSLLESYSFKKTLSRGFSIVFDEKNNVIKTKSQLKAQQNISIRFQDGDADAEIKK